MLAFLGLFNVFYIVMNVSLIRHQNNPHWLLPFAPFYM